MSCEAFVSCIVGCKDFGTLKIEYRDESPNANIESTRLGCLHTESSEGRYLYEAERVSESEDERTVKTCMRTSKKYFSKKREDIRGS